MEEMKNWADVRWQGYARKNGSKGIRNRILVIYTVKCSEFVARQIAERTNHTDVEVLGFDGCTDNQYAVNLLISLIRHPNVGGVLAVGLGCEYVQPEWLANIAREEDKEASWMFIQQEGGTRKAIEKGIKWVTEALERLKEVPRVEMGLSDLVIGAEAVITRAVLPEMSWSEDFMTNSWILVERQSLRRLSRQSVLLIF